MDSTNLLASNANTRAINKTDGVNGATGLFERLTIDVTGLREKVNAKKNDRFHQLLIKRGIVNRTPVSVLVDSGADYNVIRKGLATNVLRRKSVVAERFDGSINAPQWINEVKADMQLEGICWMT
ncbi:hypothetical protein PHMEG_00018953 [Phytophthora megakarya]|uniref:Peptidase A2 domain-containing protein n=1 Tax=Phytophthora megakarya TaxID=4795 RepID=A0A225VT32_9STRA|nr:hypothetical protein PHMEG_00018953 [Phytophthora megakarya]